MSSDLAAAKRLLDAAKVAGFAFQRVAVGPDGPLLGVRDTADHKDEVYIGGLWELDSRYATRRRKSSLVVPDGLLVTEQVCGDALTYCTPWCPTGPPPESRPAADSRTLAQRTP